MRRLSEIYVFLNSRLEETILSQVIFFRGFISDEVRFMRKIKLTVKYTDFILIHEEKWELDEDKERFNRDCDFSVDYPLIYEDLSFGRKQGF